MRRYPVLVAVAVALAALPWVVVAAVLAPEVTRWAALALNLAGVVLNGGAFIWYRRRQRIALAALAHAIEHAHQLKPGTVAVELWHELPPDDAA